MFLNLSQGEAQVRIWFGSEFDRKGKLRRSTNLFFKIGEKEYGSSVVCSAQDNFCRKIGRKMVMNKFIYLVNGLEWLTKADRRALWQAVCPEFKPSARRKRKRLGYTDGNGVWHEKDLSIAEIRRLEG